MKRAILYARVSSQRQADKDLSIPSQFAQMRQYCADNNWRIIEEIADEAESGRYIHRQGIQKIMSQARQTPPPFDALLVWKLSRFARNLRDAVNLEFELKQNGIEVISISEPLDESPMGHSFRNMMHVVNQMYSLQLSEDTKRGMSENARRGYFNGSICPMGYKIESCVDEKSNIKKRIVVDPVVAPMIKQIFKMYLRGGGYRYIANELNRQGYRTVKEKPFNNNQVGYILKNDIYVGTYRWGNVEIKDHHPSIIDNKTYEKAQQIMKTRDPTRFHARQINSRYLLSGLAYCGKCGSKMIGHSAKSGKYCYYACQLYVKAGVECCDTKFIPKDKLEIDVLDTLQERLLQPSEIQKLLTIINSHITETAQEFTQEIENKKRELGRIETRLDKLYTALETGAISLDLLAPRLKQVITEKTELESELANLESQSIDRLQILETDVEKHIRNIRSLFNEGTFEDKQAFLRSFVQKVTITDDDILIEYTVPF